MNYTVAFLSGESDKNTIQDCTYEINSALDDEEKSEKDIGRPRRGSTELSAWKL